MSVTVVIQCEVCRDICVGTTLNCAHIYWWWCFRPNFNKDI